MRAITLSITRCLIALACLVPPWSAVSAANDTEPRFLATTEWLAAHRGDRGIHVVDVRDEADYRLGHIEGAVNIPVARMFVNDNGKKFVAPLATIRQLFSNSGINNDSFVVLYDAGRFLDAARAFWVFEVYGHERVVILDGGFAAWQQQQRPVSIQDVVPQPGKFVPTVVPNRLATKLSTRLAMNRPGRVIIDARDPPDYLGEKSVAQRYGHIPSAINAPGMDHFTEINGVRRLKSVEQLAESYRQLKPGEKVITYCNVGILSAGTYFVLRHLGYDVANYDGSWLEWGNDLALPVSNPAPGTPAATFGR